MEDNRAISLEEFLASNIVENATTEIVLCERLKEFTFKIGTMTKEDHKKCQKACLIINKNGKVVDHNQALFNEMIVTNHCIYPNFKSVDFIRSVGANTAGEALNKVLKIGEINQLASEILKFNGFDEDFEKEVKEAKN